MTDGRPALEPTVLIVDNEERWQEIFSIQLSEAGYRPLTASNEVEALEQIERNRVDAVVIDVRLHDHFDDGDVSGLMLAQTIRRSYSDIGIVMKTSFSIGEELERWRSRHEALVENTVDAFLLRNLGSVDIAETMQRVFRIRVKTNFGLRIDESSEMTTLQLGTRFDSNFSDWRGMALVDEMEWLLRRLYFRASEPDVTKLRIAPLVAGMSSAEVVLIFPSYGDEELLGEVVKIDERARVERELSNFRKYVKDRLGGRRAPRDERDASTDRFGGFALTDLGIEPGELDEFGTFYDRNKDADEGVILAAISDVFEKTCVRWYRNSKPAEGSTSSWIDGEFPDWKVEFLVGVQLATGDRGDSAFVGIPEVSELAVTNPVHSLDNVMGKLRHKYRECVTHGDLNSRNLLVDKHNQTWLIDFYHTRESHLLRDFCRLEATILFERIKTENLGALLKLSQSLCQIETLDQDVPLVIEVEFPELAIASRVVRHIRRLASTAQGLGPDLTDYFVISACNALKFASFPRDVPLVRRKHAILHAAQLLDRVNRR